MNRLISTLKPLYWLLTHKEQQQPAKPPCIDATKIDPNKPCIEIYQPVKGCDNKIYGNSCKAEAAGVTSYMDYPLPARKKTGCGCGK